MNKTDLFFQMMEQPQLYTADEWQDILADEECRELYTLMSKTQSAIDAARAEEEITDDMIDAEWQRFNHEKREVKSIRFLRLLLCLWAFSCFQALPMQPSTSPVITMPQRRRTRRSSQTLNLQLPALNSLILTR